MRKCGSPTNYPTLPAPSRDGRLLHNVRMYRTLSDFTRDLGFETKETLANLSLIPDEHMQQTAYPGGRTLAFIAWHIARTFHEMGHQAGLNVDPGVTTDEPPAGMAELRAGYEHLAGALQLAVQTQWTDAALTAEIPMYGETWTKGQVLHAFIGHQAHHRGQMTILMRMAGLKVHGVYGPAKEEWALMGLPALP